MEIYIVIGKSIYYRENIYISMLEECLEVNKVQLRTFFNQYLKDHKTFKPKQITRYYLNTILNLNNNDYMYSNLILKVAGNIRILLKESLQNHIIEVLRENNSERVYKVIKI